MIRSRSTRRKPRQLEAEQQVLLMDWAHIYTHPKIRAIHPDRRLADFLYAIPNGGERPGAVGKKLKRQGLLKGVWDLHLPIPSGKWPSLWIEMKAPATPGNEFQPPSRAGELTDEQERWGNDMAKLGHLCAVCWTAVAASSVIVSYLDGLMPVECQDMQIIGGTRT